MTKTNLIQVNKGALFKTFVNEKGLSNELSGLTYLSGAKTKTPAILGVGKNKIASSYINNTVTSFEAIQKNLVKKRGLNLFVLNYLQSLKDTYNRGAWEFFISNVCKNYFANAPVIMKYLDPGLYKLTAHKIVSLKNNPNRKSKIIFLHGDLHLGNILYDTNLKEYWLIDFEHSKFGPVEYEFANSKFWEDEKSLDTDFFSKNIPCFKKSSLNSYLYLYLAEQLNIACENNDTAKIKVLSDKTREHGKI